MLQVVPGRVELPTSTLSVWRSNQLSYRTGRKLSAWRLRCKGARLHLSLVVVLLNKTVLREARDLRECPLSFQSHDIVIWLSPRKEVFQPHLPVRLPCYDLAPITSITLDRPLRSRPSSAPGFHGLTGGVYKARERIHRAMADARLLANPASWSRVADSSPN